MTTTKHSRGVSFPIITIIENCLKAIKNIQTKPIQINRSMVVKGGNSLLFCVLFFSLDHANLITNRNKEICNVGEWEIVSCREHTLGSFLLLHNRLRSTTHYCWDLVSTCCCIFQNTLSLLFYVCWTQTHTLYTCGL